MKKKAFTVFMSIMLILSLITFGNIYAEQTVEKSESTKTTLTAEDNKTSINQQDQPETNKNTNSEQKIKQEVSDQKTSNSKEEKSEPESVVASEKEYTKKELSCECKKYTVTVKAEKNIFAEDAVLEIKELSDKDSGYEKYCKEAVDTLAQKDINNVETIKLLDIRILQGDKEIEPSSKVTVNIDCEKSLNIDFGSLSVLHFTEDKTQIIEDIKVKNKTGEITFETDSFSVYAFVETSDSLDENLDENPVPLTNENKSKSATRSTRDGHISHESTNLGDFLTNVVIVSAVQDENGAYIVEKDKNYSIICSFGESSMHQFDNDAPLTYHMPDGVVVLSEQTGQMEIDIVYKGRTYQIDASYDLGTDGNLTIEFDQDDPDYIRLAESTNVSFRFSCYASFDGSETNIHFSEDIERDLVFTDPEPGEAYVTKTGYYDEAEGVFHYTVKVTATGDIEDVNVKDTLLGNALVFNNDVSVSGNSSSYTSNSANNGFDYTFDSMQEGEEITITYSAHINFTKDTDNDGKITVNQTKNTVTVEPDPGDPHTSSYSREIKYKYAVKNGEITGTTADGDKIIEWTIDYNPLALAAVGGDSVTDTISADSTAYMTYYGNGLVIEVRDHNGNFVRTDRPSYQDLEAHSPSSWTYKIPTSDNQPYSYHITYKTIVDMDAVEGTGSAVTVSNTSNGSTASVGVRPDHMIAAKKEVESYTTESITWKATFTVPETGLTHAEVIDDLPGRWINGHSYRDMYDESSLEITGRLPGEMFTVTPTATRVIIDFFYYDDNNVRHDGLKPSSGPRNIYVELTTITNQDWLEEGYTNPDTSTQNHTNRIEMNGVAAYANVIYGHPGVEKTGELVEDGVFQYTILIEGLKEDHINLTDTFDTDILQVYTGEDQDPIKEWYHMHMWGGSQYSQDFGRTPVYYTDTADGITITANSIPKDASGNYYPYYKIIYYLELEDGVDLDALAKAHGGSYDIENTVVWDDYDSTYTYRVKYDFLKKELVNKNDLGGISRTAQYEITFNPDKVTLNNGDPIEMTDVVSANLSVDYSSIRIVTDPTGVNVPYVLKGGKDEHGVPDGTTVATYTIPDNTKVTIIYDAFVRGNGEQTITNKVTALDEEEVVEDTKDYGSASEGQGAIASFKIVKTDGYDANKKLSGVRFKVYAANDELDFGEDNDYAKEIILTTNPDGEIVLDGDQYEFYFNELYYVEEIDPPPGYGKLDTIYNVTLTSDMSQVNYGRYIYYYNDSMQIKNYPLEGLVIEKQVESSDSSDKARDYNFRVTVLNNDGTINTDYNEQTSSYRFENGVCEFTLKHNQQKMFWGFTKNTKYKVEEIFGEGEEDEFNTSFTYKIFDEQGDVIETATVNDTEHTGTLTQAEELVVFKNSKTDTIVPTGVWYRKDALILLPILAVLVMFAIALARRRSSTGG